MKTLIASFPEHLEEALQNAKSCSFKQAVAPINNIVLLGLGGSGIGGSIVQSLTLHSLKVPFLVTKNYDIPAFVGQNTLVIASSFSGNTEETLIALELARNAGAQIACITSGGKLKSLAIENDYDLIPLTVKAECPRAHLAFSMVALLILLNKKSLLGDASEEILNAAKYLRENEAQIRKESAFFATKLTGKLPFLYSDDTLGAVLVRFQQQINENAKQICHVNVFPEMNHNELVGWVHPENILKNSIVLIFESISDHPRVRVRMDVCEPIFNRFSESLRIKGIGATNLEQVLYLIHLTDWISYDLALENKVDPFPVEIINHLKGELAKHDK